MHAQHPEWVTELYREVRKRLKEAGSTQIALAAYLGMTPKHLNHILKGRQHASAVILDRLAAAVGLRIALADAGVRPVLAKRQPSTSGYAFLPEPEDLDDVLGED